MRSADAWRRNGAAMISERLHTTTGVMRLSALALVIEAMTGDRFSSESADPNRTVGTARPGVACRWLSAHISAPALDHFVIVRAAASCYDDRPPHPDVRKTLKRARRAEKRWLITRHIAGVGLSLGLPWRRRPNCVQSTHTALLILGDPSSNGGVHGPLFLTCDVHNAWERDSMVAHSYESHCGFLIISCVVRFVLGVSCTLPFRFNLYGKELRRVNDGNSVNQYECSKRDNLDAQNLATQYHTKSKLNSKRHVRRSSFPRWRPFRVSRPSGDANWI